MRCRGTTFLSQRPSGRARSCAGGPFCFFTPLSEIAIGLSFRPLRARSRRRQFNSCSSGLGEPDGYGLLGRTCTLFTGPNMLHFFTDKFAGLCGWRIALPLVLTSPCASVFFWHDTILSPAHSELDVTNSRVMLCQWCGARLPAFSLVLLLCLPLHNSMPSKQHRMRRRLHRPLPPQRRQCFLQQPWGN